MPAMAIPRKVRKNPRAQVSLVARYRSPTAFEYVEEECHDLSLGGMFIRSVAPAPAGTLIKLECDIAGGSCTIRGVARVVWLRDSASDGQPAGMGVKFIKLDPGARDAIKNVLEQLMAVPDGEGLDTGEDESSARMESQRVPREEGHEPEAATHGATTEQELASPDEPAAPVPEEGEFTPAQDPGWMGSAGSADRAPLAPPPATRRHAFRLKIGVAAVALLMMGVAARALLHSPAPSEARPTPRPAARPAVLPASPQQAQPAAAPAAAPPPPEPAVTHYVLDVITNPSRARVFAGAQSWHSPARIEFEQHSPPSELTIEKEGFEPTTLPVDPRMFTLEESAWRRRVVLSLTRAPKRARASKTRSATRPKPSTSADESSTQDRLKSATSCLARGDNRCVIRTLEGKATTARELEMLVETYRATGNLAKAQQSMRAYVDKYPTGERATGYRQVLERQAKAPQRPRG